MAEQDINMSTIYNLHQDRNIDQSCPLGCDELVCYFETGSSFSREDTESTKQECKKILKRPHPARTESDTTEMILTVPSSQTTITRYGRKTVSMEHNGIESERQTQSIYIVKGASITRRLPPGETLFEALDPVDDVGDNL